jgi:glycosyltransferase involved in cell wall biosynthesis
MNRLKNDHLKQFNTKNSLLVIATYPEKDTTHTGGGLASYTKNTLLAIKQASPSQKIVVLANITDIKESYLEDDILVVRCWERNSLGIYPAILKQLFHFYKAEKVLFGFEFSAYGDLFITTLLPIFLLAIKAAGKNIASVVHQVTPNLLDLATHTGLNRTPHKIHFYNLALSLYFNLLGLAANKVVTLEQTLADRFNLLVPGNKAVAIPHGLYPKKPIERTDALHRLSLNPDHLYVLCFGYLSHYKGSDLIVKAFKKPITVNGKKVRLILAGGESPTQGQKHHYRHFYKKLYQTIDNNPNIIHTGFVPDSRIKTFFSAADIVAFPYRAFMSASGPLSLAIAYQKPFIVSHKLQNYSQNIFQNNPDFLRKMIKQTLSSQNTLNDMIQSSKKMARERNFANQGDVYLKLFETKKFKIAPAFS